MADERWEEQFKQFLRKTGDDFRRAGEDVKTEAQRLLDAAIDPQKQQRVRDRLKELTGWARKTAEDVAGMVETAASKAEQAFHRATDKVSPAPRTPSESEPSRGVAEGRTAASAYPKRASKKTTGKVKVGKPAQKSGGKRKR
jgi:hypothetical protein